MVVGEPSLMGGEFGDEDERLITRLENTQYDTTSVEDGSGSGAPQGTGPVHRHRLDSRSVVNGCSSVDSYTTRLGASDRGEYFHTSITSDHSFCKILCLTGVRYFNFYL